MSTTTKGRASRPKLPREHFVKIGAMPHQRRPKGLGINSGIQRIMTNFQVSRRTAYRMLKKYGLATLDQCGKCGHDFSEHRNGKCPKIRREELRVPPQSETTEREQNLWHKG